MAIKNPENELNSTVENTFVTWSRQKGWNPLKIISGEGSYFTDSSGKSYLDMSSQLMCCHLGYGNKNVINAIKKQAETLSYIGPSFDTDIRETVSEKLKSILPDNMGKYFYGTSGTEANEAAIKIARMYMADKKKNKIISFYNSYHGSTLGSLQLTGDFRRMLVDSYENASGFLRVAPQFCYHCPFKLKYPECNLACAENLEYTIKQEGNIAAVIFEPVTGTNGVVVPPDGFVKRLREITEENDVLLIADEVMTGFCRTGEWFAVNHWNVKPDIITTAKGITAAYAPLSLTAVDKKISDFFEDHIFAHGHTYEAHPLMLAAASAAIDEYKNYVLDHVRRISPLFEKRIKELRENHVSVGDVRSIGLFGGVEINYDRENRIPFNTAQDKIDGKPLMVSRIAKYAMEHGVYLNTWISHFIVAPPLIISEEDLNRGFDVIDEALKISDAEVKK
ncbi:MULTISPECIES: aspartate aminotransferase family protein [Acidiplasma]|jgi:taurine--2-oxoglutarate transaminase|uniref:Aminotransferase n=2 Tax=Acidiplasma TaxID=507753 RepID=A0A0P9CIA3_9ARCH|nr:MULTISPECIES: aspartate aminotransferase family protein [Acidiplasma]KJE49222.1 aminotransferase [Acidiplasma sp. MBA-1]KPV45172.1 aminotransferase [Acidiplasma aeolicum]WMT54813.1 MAG: aspartate aminotransferase family protein [Acidiplasma sp.]